MADFPGTIVKDIPDAELVSRILNGEKTLFELIIRRYNQRLYRTGMSVLGNEQEVEDAMQTAYINAYEHLAQFENRSSLNTWLTRILLNECFRLKRKHSRLRVTSEGDNFTTMNTPAKELHNKELSRILEEAIARLPEKYRLVFVLREIEELSTRETSEILEIGEANVKVRLNRAKSSLRENLKGYLSENIYPFHLSKCNQMVQQVMNHLGIA